MRFYACLIAVAATVAGAFCGCKNGEVLLDETERSIINDSITIRQMECIPDSMEIILNTPVEWNASVAKGADWCRISKQKGAAGKDTIIVYVDENPTASVRKTSVILESGTVTRVFRVKQKAGEAWFDTKYWYRTAAQRLGIRGMVESIYETEGKFPNRSITYTFDPRGNMISKEYRDQEYEHRYDTVTAYTYDDDNHRLSCDVMLNDGQTVRKWRYEYENKGMLVAYSARGWLDSDPLAEVMEGMVVPDLSAAYGYRSDRDYVYGEEHLYTFDESGRLNIVTHYWKRSKEAPSDSIPTGGDTLRVEYRNGLPYTSKYVSNSVYYKNTGMLMLLETRNGRFDLLENSHRMVVSSYRSKNAEMLEDKEIEWFESKYNYNKDQLTRLVQYKGVGFVTEEKYYRYEYDDMHNWLSRMEDVPKAGYSEAQENYRHRMFSYYR